VVQLNRDLRLVDEHRDELFVLGNARQDPFDRQQPLEALHAEGLGLEHLGHAADVDALEQVALAEWDWLLHDMAPRATGAQLKWPLPTLGTS
jgi:hypothetical protein